jgi:hypothetical protein
MPFRVPKSIRYPDRAPTPEELARVIDVADLRDKVIVSLLAVRASFAPRTYAISAYATPVQGETNVANNTFVDGTVQIVQRMSGGGGGRMLYMD